MIRTAAQQTQIARLVGLAGESGIRGLSSPADAASCMESPQDQRRVSASAARVSPRSTSTSGALTAASVLSRSARTSGFYSGQSLQSMTPIMIIEPAATAREQITGNSSRTATTAAHPLILFPRAKRHPAAPIRKLRLAPSSSAV
jgi:hypothetical protein